MKQRKSYLKKINKKAQKLAQIHKQNVYVFMFGNNVHWEIEEEYNKVYKELVKEGIGRYLATGYYNG